MKQSLYQYIKENIDKDEVFTSPTLPDQPHPTVPRALGSDDAFFYTTEAPADQEGAKTLASLLRTYLRQPTPERKQALYKGVKVRCMTALCDPFLDIFQKEEFHGHLLDLARSLFYNAMDREVLKFAYLLFALYGMERIRKSELELWRDLVTVAHCEEFTFFFLYACRSSACNPQKEIWELLGCTNGWGKVYALNDVQPTEEWQQEWLIKYGMDLEVEYFPLAASLLTKTHLLNYLETAEPDYDGYKGAGVILNNYLLLLNNFPLVLLEESFHISTIPLYPLITAYLKQAQDFAKIPEELLDVLSISTGLTNLLKEERYYGLTANEINQLIASCDQLIYQEDWRDYLERHLIKKGVVNYLLLDFALELEVDLWPRLHKFWRTHPLEIGLFPYLLSYLDETDRSRRMIAEITERIHLYADNQDALVMPMRYLKEHPGEGEGILIFALTGMYDWPRGIACAIIDEWGLEYLTPALREALWKARKLSGHKVIDARIDALLAGRQFNLREMMKKDTKG